MPSASLVVTVGSTRFQQLTDEALSPAFLNALPALGIGRVVVQLGSADVPSSGASSLSAEGSTHVTPAGDDVRVRALRYTSDAADLRALLADADVVVSHAGSGTILDVLRLTPPAPRLVVVPNTALMDNHQRELADALGKDGYLQVATVDSLLSSVETALRGPAPKPFPAPRPELFKGVLDRLAGFA